MGPRADPPAHEPRPGRTPVVTRPGPAGWARLVASRAYERALARPAAARTPHFALHRDLSTEQPSMAGQAVDKRLGTVHDPVHGSVDARAAERALGLVVPKRHARRAVTRSLLKRQIRSVARSAGADLATGLWVVRLRAPFDRARFTSAASPALARAARDELQRLFADPALPRRAPVAALDPGAAPCA